MQHQSNAIIEIKVCYDGVVHLSTSQINTVESSYCSQAQSILISLALQQY